MALGMGLLVAGALGGCGMIGSPGAMRVTSRGQERAELPLNLPTRLYDSKDSNSADFYLTDLPREVWMGGADVSAMSGVMVHVHMFIAPKAGKTPIETTASSAAVRVLVLSNGELGVYGGGGFFSKSGSAGEKTFGGGLKEGTVQLIRATAGFEDRLGPGYFSGSISATRDPEQTAAMRRAFNYLASFGTVVGEEEDSTLGR
ncbi:hypothetical protein PHYC_03182 [Phycisphaerales bacterium]|nr:hypothetical protein PHYC_03182 [Phycisphaerales bacterium]